MLNNLIIFPDDRFYVKFSQNRSWKLYNYSEQKLLINELEPLVVPRQSDSVSLIVFLSEKCNLRCSYCKYDKMIRSPSKYETDVIAIVKSIEKFCHKKSKVIVSFFGGEPMLEYKKMGEICEKLINCRNIQYSITTNGTILNNEIIEILKRYNISVGVSIDGDYSLHDINRTFTNLKSSQNTVVKNYRRMKELSVKCGPVAVVIEPKRIMEMMTYFHEEFGDLSVHFKPLDITGTENLDDISNYYDNLLKEQVKLLKWMLLLYKKSGVKFSETHIDSYLNNILLSSIELGESCHTGPHCGMGETLFSLSITGEVSVCHDLSKFENVTPEYIGTLKSRNDFCSDCSYSPVCSSFCAAQFDQRYWKEFVNNNNKSYIDIICKYNKGFIREIFKIIYLDKQLLINYMLD